jgi:hypothetical protein
MMATGATILERVYTAGTIADSELLASEWIEWSSLKDSWSPSEKGERTRVKGLIRGTLRNAGLPGKFDARYDEYGVLCCAKHGNPRLLQIANHSDTDVAYVLNADAEYSPNAVRWIEVTAWLILNACLTSVTALGERGMLRLDASKDLDRASANWRVLDDRIGELHEPRSRP